MQRLLVAVTILLLALQRPRPKPVHLFFCFHLGDDRHRRESIHVHPVPEIVIVVKVRVQHETHGLVCPLPDLRDIFACGRRQEAGVHDKHLPVPDNYRRISAASFTVLDLINPIRKLCHFAFRLSGHLRSCSQQCD